MTECKYEQNTTTGRGSRRQTQGWSIDSPAGTLSRLSQRSDARNAERKPGLANLPFKSLLTTCKLSEKLVGALFTPTSVREEKDI
ncbi:hypothetical protein EYF80_027407 [Liparis tanakae]|uniref:Uncharacterized protein n=1 Tax=Liparis tanakae TaxID=230148 RepID=A0A4Z2H9F5_9TELE|nr:hypothetical protein EYF80_027407 [Liparis tanakae]